MDIYLLARAVIEERPGIGKERLATLLGVVPNTSAKLLARFQGETNGHSPEPEYQKLVQLKREQGKLNDHQTLKELVSQTGIDLDRAKRCLARYKGATERPPQLPANCNWRKYLKQPPEKLKSEELYKKIRELLTENPAIGMQRLGRLTGCRTHRARLIREEIRGQTEGHSAEPDYQQLLEIVEARQANGSRNAAPGPESLAKTLRISKSRARVLLAHYRGASKQTIPEGPISAPGIPTTPIPSPTNDRSTTRWDTTDEKVKILGCRGTQIQTPEELLAAEKVDREVWNIERCTTKRKDKPAGFTEIQIQLRKKSNLLTPENGILAQLEKLGAAQPPVTYKKNETGTLFVPSLADLHVGKYAAAAETGAAYNPDIARQLAVAAMTDLLGRAGMYQPSLIVVPCGNDLLNVDGMERATTNGTPQDEATRWQESFVFAKALMINLINQCRQMAPTHVVVVPGNHDTERSWYLGQTIEAYFRHTSGVSIDNAPTSRKYFHWGRVLLGWVHGDDNRHERLPIVMAQERPTEWAASDYREWQLGHYHSRKRKWVCSDEDQSGVLIRLMPSLCAADYWHSKKGYWARRAAEGYVYDKDRGLIAELTYSIPPSTQTLCPDFQNN